MSSSPRQHQIRSLAVPVARALLASIVTLSFFATMAQLTKATAGLMACCVGKSGHESGSCSSGLRKAARKPQPEPEVLCGGEPAQPTLHSMETVVVEAEAEDGGHCDHHEPSAGAMSSDAAKQSEPQATSAKSEKPKPAVHTLSSPCSEECASCSISFTRRPRPREQSTLSSMARPRLHFTSRLLLSGYPQIKTLNPKWMQLRPRAPPFRLALKTEQS
jgi:hypothetical protein